mmetsp:Transcript_122281/g.243419  ORF Transcript_122281/g.243419 Transcript_122281/m.243419 type:complete len:228 (-) Transcript_122281:59-742(-)
MSVARGSSCSSTLVSCSMGTGRSPVPSATLAREPEELFLLRSFLSAKSRNQRGNDIANSSHASVCNCAPPARLQTLAYRHSAIRAAPAAQCRSKSAGCTNATNARKTHAASLSAPAEPKVPWHRALPTATDGSPLLMSGSRTCIQMRKHRLMYPTGASANSCFTAGTTHHGSDCCQVSVPMSKRNASTMPTCGVPPVIPVDASAFATIADEDGPASGLLAVKAANRS